MSAEPGICAEKGFVAPYVKKGILTPTTENTLNVGDSTTISSKNRKRKRSSGALVDLLEEPFFIRVGFKLESEASPVTDYAHYESRKQTLPSSAPNEVTKLTPVLLIPRSHLPFSFLDPIAASARLFSAHIRGLEDNEPGHPYGALVMVAELETEGSLYVVERVQCGLYALCRLGGWVNVEELRPAALAFKKHSAPVMHRPLSVLGQASWWECAAVEPLDADGDLRAKRLKANSSGSLRLKMRSSAPQTSPEPSRCGRAAVSPQSETATAAPEPPTLGSCERTCGVEVSAQESLDTLRCQYLEALYLSKTSLAYFVKGPLSRARANFQAEKEAPVATSELVVFLRSSILTFTVFDKKYREAVPQIIQSVPLGNLSNDEDNTRSQATIKCKNKKKRLGKDGLYPKEEDYIRQWWRARELDSHDAAPNAERDEEAKRLIVELRTRETQMQLVLVLEVMALEASLTEAVDHNELGEHGAQVQDDGKSQAKKRRPKRRQDLNLLLDLLIDRLTIWQSVSLPEEVSRPSTSLGTSKSQDHVRMRQRGVASATHENNEQLRDFCVEAIVPFYAARLPETCSNVNQRLGGVKVISPARPLMLKSASTSQGLLRPGTVIDRNGSTQSQKPLERDLAFKKPFSRRQQPPSLLRSATAPALKGLKRESSEISLSDIPLKRPSVEKSKRYSQREVDLSAISNATEAKLRRKASVEEELRGAIATLKKPNRTLAVKELVESIEHRVHSAGASSRKSRNPIRNPFGQGVQVMATPKGNRKKNVFGRAPRLAREPSPVFEEVPHTIPFVEPHIPSSVTRPSAIRQFPDSNFGVPPNRPCPVRQTLSTVMQTPTRGHSKLVDVLAIPQRDREEDELCQETSPRPPRSKVLQTPDKALKLEPRRSLSFTTAASSFQLHATPPKPIQTSALGLTPSRGIAATPLKHLRSSPTESGVAGTYQKAPQESHKVEGSKSIYESLGWDDDTDDLL